MECGALAAALVLAGCNLMHGTNIAEREAYWKREIASALPSPATVAHLRRFTAERGETLTCYRHTQRLLWCDIVDHRSEGGPGNLRVRLIIRFEAQDDVVVLHAFTTVPVSALPL